MPRLELKSRPTAAAQGTAAPRRCTRCLQDLLLVRRRDSPARLGPVVVIEFYQCVACDWGYAFNPGAGTWKHWMPEDEG